MKKIYLLVFTFLLTSSIYAQKKMENLDEYSASNGITYKIGDEIKLGRGSDTNGKFVYISVGGWAVSSNPEANRLGAGNSGLLVTIKKIKRYDYKRFKGVHFTVGGGNITNYILDIENAINTCEVENCKNEKETAKPLTDKYDELKKLKELLEDGALNNSEYEIEKKKILNQ